MPCRQSLHFTLKNKCMNLQTRVARIIAGPGKHPHTLLDSRTRMAVPLQGNGPRLASLSLIGANPWNLARIAISRARGGPAEIAPSAGPESAPRAQHTPDSTFKAWILGPPVSDSAAPRPCAHYPCACSHSTATLCSFLDISTQDPNRCVPSSATAGRRTVYSVEATPARRARHCISVSTTMSIPRSRRCAEHLVCCRCCWPRMNAPPVVLPPRGLRPSTRWRLSPTIRSSGSFQDPIILYSKSSNLSILHSPPSPQTFAAFFPIRAEIGRYSTNWADLAIWVTAITAPPR